MKKVYLDNAATTFPKAPGVAEAMSDYILNVGSNVGRGSYESSYSAGQIVYETRELLCEMFNFNDPLNAVFTSNITQSLNMITRGYLKPGDHVIISSMEHNAVVRPLVSLQKIGVEFDKVMCDSEGKLNPSDIEPLIKPNTKMLIMTHASNVCGTILPLEEVGLICKKHNIYFVVDSAQTAGVIPIDFEKFNLSALTFTGHKGLLGPQGIGGFLIDMDFANEVSSIYEGGTGSLSESETQPDYMPDKFESGTLNIPGIYGLNASLKYVNSYGLSAIEEKEKELSSLFINDVLSINSAKIAGIKGTDGRTSTVSINFENYDNSEIAFLLDKEYGIMTRVGLHCAPSAHKTLGTFPSGTVRFSFGHFNTIDEVKYTIDSINNVLKLL
ncbi:aminotransferase class V-fold PLP-dependent enzyme [Clostridium cylindrosporum]|uniref:cysteine desulfurase n=1 Tax=Clostridium cylindrosporum DSM 605 TaxID=1121307 RepID=A0A0J8D4Y1_CLOCY|nr:aminotransferase class V-fold PLP-dependent enzyme [Clostridium cylindrosporum]KMT20877.1 putative cysteine desulfurase Csd [Clostridium cylindrosporum DSM 605]